MRLVFLLLAALSATCYPQLPPYLFSPLIAQKLLACAQLTPGVPTLYPQYTTRDTGVWRYFGADTWTSGFLPATSYALAERATICLSSLNDTTATQWLEIARSSATGEVPLETHTSVGHDLGFLSFPFADELNMYVTLTSGLPFTRSWDTPNPDVFEVIIDNMMNLEVLFNAAELTGNQTLRQIAISHADRTMMNHVRADGAVPDRLGPFS